MDKNRLAELELKWLNGSISDDEAKEYATWYNSAQNDPVIIPEHIASSKEEHKTRILEGLLAKLEGKNIQKLEPKPLWYRNKTYIGIAASILMVLGIASYWFISDSNPPQTITVQDKTAGIEGLILSLENGETVEIDSLADGLIASQDGIEIYKKDGSIYYKGEAGKTSFNTAHTPKGRKFEIQLPDGSNVWLNAESTIKYPIEFAENERKVHVTGEAYFEVSKNPEAPFIVQTEDQIIQVLGTQFNVNSYTNENSSKTTLLEGKVKISCKGEELFLSPNQQITYDRNNERYAKSEVNAKQSISWVKGYFNFQDSDLAGIMKQIERWYNIEVEFQPGVNQSQTFSGRTSMNQNLSEVLKVLELSGIKTQLQNNKLTVFP